MQKIRPVSVKVVCSQDEVSGGRGGISQVRARVIKLRGKDDASSFVPKKTVLSDYVHNNINFKVDIYLDYDIL